MLQVTLSIILQEVRFDIGQQSSDEENQSVVLCVVKYGGNGVLEMVPDFTWSHRPYRLEVEGSREVHEYWLEHASPAISYDQQLRETLMLNEVYTRHSQIQLAEVGDDFEMPPAGMFRLHVAGEIVSAADYEYRDLVVNFLLDLPPGWAAGPDSQLSGLTQKCTAVADETGRDVAHFSFPFEADLFFNINQLDADRDILPGWPQVSASRQ